MSRDDKDQHGDWITVARRRLAAKRGKKPETKAAQIWALWPELKVALATGQRVGTLCDWLREEAEIQVTPDTLRSYIARCRRKENMGCTLPLAPGILAKELVGNDPMAVARQALDKSRFDIRRIHGDGDPSKHNLI